MLPCSATNGIVGVGPGTEGWTEKHEKEVVFQRSKRVRRAIETMEQGALLPHEQNQELGDPDMANMVLQGSQRAERDRIVGYLKRHNQKLIARSPRVTATVLLDHKRLFIDRTVVGAIRQTRLDNRLAELHLRNQFARGHHASWSRM
jgi:hypothetical protein